MNAIPITQAPEVPQAPATTSTPPDTQRPSREDERSIPATWRHYRGTFAGLRGTPAGRVQGAPN